jgi:hypothetical protein
VNLNVSILARISNLFQGYYPNPEDPDGNDGPFGGVHPHGPHGDVLGRVSQAAHTFVTSMVPLHQLELGLPKGELQQAVSGAIGTGVLRMIDDCGNEPRRIWWWPRPPKGGDGGDEPRPISPTELSVLALEFARVSVALGEDTTLGQQLGKASLTLLELGER